MNNRRRRNASHKRGGAGRKGLSRRLNLHGNTKQGTSNPPLITLSPWYNVTYVITSDGKDLTATVKDVTDGILKQLFLSGNIEVRFRMLHAWAKPGDAAVTLVTYDLMDADLTNVQSRSYDLGDYTRRASIKHTWSVAEQQQVLSPATKILFEVVGAQVIYVYALWRSRVSKTSQDAYFKHLAHGGLSDSCLQEASTSQPDVDNLSDRFSDFVIQNE